MNPFRSRKPGRERRRGAPRQARPRDFDVAGKRGEGAASEARAALTRGLRATAGRGRGAGPWLKRASEGALRRLRPVAAGAFRLAASLERGLRGGSATLAAYLGAGATRLSRILTPERAVFGVTVAAAGCLLMSQFVDYRGVEVGEPGYAEVASIAPPPQRAQQTPNEAHAYLLIPVALAAIGLAAVALVRRRWRLGRLVSLSGLAAVAVTLAIDMPSGLDEGRAELLFAGAHATLNDGFYAELAASGALVLCGLLLAANLRPARRVEHGSRPERHRRRPRLRKTPSLARSGT